MLTDHPVKCYNNREGRPVDWCIQLSFNWIKKSTFWTQLGNKWQARANGTCESITDANCINWFVVLSSIWFVLMLADIYLIPILLCNLIQGYSANVCTFPTSGQFLERPKCTVTFWHQWLPAINGFILSKYLLPLVCMCSLSYSNLNLLSVFCDPYASIVFSPNIIYLCVLCWFDNYWPIACLSILEKGKVEGLSCVQ